MLTMCFPCKHNSCSNKEVLPIYLVLTKGRVEVCLLARIFLPFQCGFLEVERLGHAWKLEQLLWMTNLSWNPCLVHLCMYINDTVCMCEREFMTLDGLCRLEQIFKQFLKDFSETLCENIIFVCSCVSFLSLFLLSYLFLEYPFVVLLKVHSHI